MLGAIAGDVIGSVYEAAGLKSKRFPLFGPESEPTDDSVLTYAVADVMLNGGDYVDAYHDWFHRYPDAGYGGTFIGWAHARRRDAYGSWGNGSAMRVSPVAYARSTLDEVLAEAERSAAVTHNHPEGIRGAQAVAGCVYLARTGASKADIRALVRERIGYNLDRTLAMIRPRYVFDVSCQGSVPESILAFLESHDFEDAVRNAISLGGDADTMACIAGAIAEPFYGGVPAAIAEATVERLDSAMREVVEAFREGFTR